MLALLSYKVCHAYFYFLYVYGLDSSKLKVT